MNGAPDGDFSDSESETDTDLDELLEDLDELQWLLSQGIKEINALRKKNQKNQSIKRNRGIQEDCRMCCIFLCICMYCDLYNLYDL